MNYKAREVLPEAGKNRDNIEVKQLSSPRIITVVRKTIVDDFIKAFNADDIVHERVSRDVYAIFWEQF